MNENYNFLDEDLSGVKAAQPLLPKGLYTVEIVKVEERKSETKNYQWLNITTKTTEPHTSVEGEPIPPGRLVNCMIGLTPRPTNTENRDPGRTVEEIRRDCKRFMLACGVKNGRLQPLDQWVGKNAKVKIRITKPTDAFPEPGNDINGWEYKE